MNRNKPKEKLGRNKQIFKPKVSFLEWVEIHKFKTVLVFLAIFFVPLILIWFFYSGILPPFISSGWNEGDLLSYIAGFETLLGTIILSFLALRQTEKIKKDDDKLHKADVKRPFFVIEKIRISKYKIQKELEYEEKTIENEPYFFQFEVGTNTSAHICLKNIGEGLAANVEYITPNKKIYFESGPSWVYANSGKEIPIRASLFDDKGELSQTRAILINYQNIVGIKYSQIICVNINKELYEIAPDTQAEEVVSNLNFSVTISSQMLDPEN